MKVNKNQCTTCGYNFFTETLFFDHRIGKYPADNAGVSTRRCLSVEEMSLKGWVVRTLDVTVWVEGDKTTTPMPTWAMSGQVEAREGRDEIARERMKTIRKKQR